MQVIESLALEAYHNHPAVSNTLLGYLKKSPAHAKAFMEGERWTETPAMKEGTALHCALLEPERFAMVYRPFDTDRRTNAGKAEYAELLATGKIPLKSEAIDRVWKMAGSLRRIPVLEELLRIPHLKENSVFWVDPVSGLECRCRPDIFWPSLGILVDIKKCRDASPRGFARALDHYDYHRQDAHYRAGTGSTRFIFAAVEPEAPFAAKLHEIDAASLENGRAERAELLKRYAECAESGVWPGYGDDINEVSLPAYRFGGDDADDIAFTDETEEA
jgi:exodeoxyribonuclease VIII